MGDGHLWVLATQVISAIDFNSYGLKDWLQLIGAVIGAGVSIYGAWKAWRFSKWQMVNRLFEYLNTDEKNVTEGRRRVLEHLRNGRGPALKSGVELHENIEKAISLLDRGHPVEAEEALSGFVLMLAGSAEVGRRHTAVASQQAATILLFIGLIAKKRADVPAARNALLEAFDHCPDDAEVVRSLGELDLNSGNLPQAQKHFDRAIALAGRDGPLQAEVWALKAEACRKDDDKRRQIEALLMSASIFAEIADHTGAASAYSSAGDLQVSLRHTKRARRSFRSAFDSYEQMGNLERMNAMKEKLVALRVDVSSLSTPSEPSNRPFPWYWVRLGLEVLILGAALYVFLMLR